LKDSGAVFCSYYDESGEPVTTLTEEPEDSSSLLIHAKVTIDGENTTLGLERFGYRQESPARTVSDLGILADRAVQHTAPKHPPKP